MYGHQRGRGKWDKLGDWDIYIYPTMYKIDNKWELTVEHRELYSMLCSDLNGKEIQKRRNYIYIYIYISYIYIYIYIYFI